MATLIFGGDRGRSTFGELRHGSNDPIAKPKVPDGDTVRIYEKDGPRSEENTKLWINAQIPYPNMASNEEIGNRAISYVQSVVREYEDKTAALRRRFRIINHMFRGNSVANVWALDEVHVPLIYVKVENAIPRMEKAMLSYDPWVRAESPNGKVGKMDLLRRTSFIDSQLSEINAKAEIQPSLRDVFQCQACMFKTWWERKEDWRVIRTVDENERDGGTEYVIRRERKRVLVREGPNMKLVDPFDMIIDTRATSPKTALYVGDRCKMTKEQIKELGRQGVFMNTEGVDKLHPSGDATSGAYYDKISRSVTERYAEGRDRPVGMPEELEVVNLWGWFDLYGNGEAVESCITVVEGKLCVQAIENFYDDKHRPYAVARAAKEGRDFFNVGPLDHAVKLNEEYDQHRALGLEAHKQSICPIVFAEDDSDLPDSLFGIDPGTVFRSVGKVQFAKIPDTLQSLPMIEGKLERNIDEATGIPSIYEGVDPGASGPTATHAIALQSNANERIAGILRPYSEMWEEIFRQFDAMNGQFLTKKVKYAVGGVSSKALGDYDVVSPKTFHERIDYKMVGMQFLETIGNRASGMANYLNIAEPYRQEFPEVVNVPELLRDYYNITVGMRPGEDIVKVPSAMEELYTPDEENDLILMGESVSVDEQDDDEYHIERHMAALDAGHMEGDDEIKLLSHIMTHELQLERKGMKEKAARSKSPQFALGMGADANQEQLPSSPFESFGLAAEDTQTPLGESAGPPDARKYGQPGRNTPTAQPDNRIGMSA